MRWLKGLPGTHSLFDDASANKCTFTFNRMTLCLTLVILVAAAAVGCTAKGAATEPSAEAPAVEEVPVPLPEPEPEPEPEPAPQSEESQAWTARWLEERPIFVMMDNHSGARPQSGLKEALFVYEMLAEGNITRYMAVFTGTEDYEVGPIRSARPYFINRALEYDGIYVHVGGSPQAFADLVNLKVADVDGLSAGKNVFWRRSHKKIPHNMYSTLEAIRRDANRRKYRTEASFEVPVYASAPLQLEGEAAASVRFVYREGSSGYASGYKYDEASGLYQRYVNGKIHVDELDDVPIQAANVIVQTVRAKTVDNEGRLVMEDVGSGKGWLISMGTRIPVKWEKADRRAQTVYKMEDGTPIELMPGVTWIQVIPQWLEPVWNEEA
ncbi:DUF3048 domain-containing protein [Acidaminobacter hydrogenoformans]|uniref:DUF3048 domain-containing protein n=1 Tax=Acidaminobacter hydrogenoformans DSM 2784 TaxID=1120920 RepID=A0A1G5RSS9_9FIRM|nr:DUF3048 domain-containing protein [Acidaminobacter hydrogenoformans]SCZ77155.1 Protein of unknown function [Acidaminobacter hydrogenoformans DSM 2784]